MIFIIIKIIYKVNKNKFTSLSSSFIYNTKRFNILYKLYIIVFAIILYAKEYIVRFRILIKIMKSKSSMNYNLSSKANINKIYI